MADATEMLRRWAAHKLDVPVEVVLEVTFEHEDGYSNESGTWWPEENTAVVTLAGKNGRKIRSEFSLPGGVDEIPALLAEIVEHGSEVT